MSHQRAALGATPVNLNATTVRARGQASTEIVRRISHINRCGSRSSSPSSGIQRTPHSPSASTTVASSWPQGVSEYEVRPSISVRSTTPARLNDFSRLDKSAGDIFGTPRRRSLKCALPCSNSRTTSNVHRSSSNSIALATGQNWPYVDISAPFTRLCPVDAVAAGLTSTDREPLRVHIWHWNRFIGQADDGANDQKGIS